MATASISAQIADLLGIDPTALVRPSVAEAQSACAPGQVLAATDDGGRDVAVARTDDGRLFIVADACPHDGSALSTGFIDGDRLVCARHGWEFDLATGHCPFRQACIDTRRG